MEAQNNLPEIMAAIRSSEHVRQVLFRNINYPSTATNKRHPAIEWIDKNVHPAFYAGMYSVMIDRGLPLLRVIPHTGSAIYDWKGTSICFSDYCLQEANRTEDIRSLIYHQDGHVYTSWDSPASILF